MVSSATGGVTATAPAQVILTGEHAVNYGQPALAASVGLHVTCVARPADAFRLSGAGRTQTTTRREIFDLAETIDACQAYGDLVAIQRLIGSDFFAPAKYVLAALGDALPVGLDVSFGSEIPPSAGLGSSGATVVALAAATVTLLNARADGGQIAILARRGEIVAHGGATSELGTQTSLRGGVVRYILETPAQPVSFDRGLSLVIGATDVPTSSGDMNARIRSWVAASPSRRHYFDEIGLLSRLAEVALRDGDWPELGRLLNLNQLVLERIGVSRPELSDLIEASIEAGALGAKLSGWGGGGSMIALVTPESAESVTGAIRDAGGEPIVAPVGVPGVKVSSL
jgi:mevalonate kinase